MAKTVNYGRVIRDARYLMRGDHVHHTAHDSDNGISAVVLSSPALDFFTVVTAAGKELKAVPRNRLDLIACNKHELIPVFMRAVANAKPNKLVHALACNRKRKKAKK